MLIPGWIVIGLARMDIITHLEHREDNQLGKNKKWDKRGNQNENTCTLIQKTILDPANDENILYYLMVLILINTIVFELII